jgi:uncharacterized protein YndB with AHSA1/START domain
MIELDFETEIHRDAETVFGLIANLRGYDRWLTRSTAYPGTAEISAEPIAVGTTYVESAANGVRRGTITEYQPPARIAFHQPMTMKPRALGVIDIEVGYTLTPRDDRVQVGRRVRLAIPWQLKAARPVVVRQFRAESERTMRVLKAFAESSEST